MPDHLLEVTIKAWLAGGSGPPVWAWLCIERVSWGLPGSALTEAQPSGQMPPLGAGATESRHFSDESWRRSYPFVSSKLRSREGGHIVLGTCECLLDR